MQRLRGSTVELLRESEEDEENDSVEEDKKEM